MTATERIPLLYVGGAGRSGSTLIDRVLGQMPGHWSVGELSFLWRASLRKDWPCGCGRPFSKCEFWTEVGQVGFGGWQNIDAERMRALQDSVDRYQRIPQLAMPHSTPAFARRLHYYGNTLAQLYGAVKEVSGASVLVDSSKTPATAFLLRRLASLDLRLVHLVRNPHGVVYSWAKTGMENAPGTNTASGEMDTWSLRHTVRHWWTTNVALDASRLLGIPTVLMRYEDFVMDPRRELSQVSELLGRPVDDNSFDYLLDEQVELRVSHTAAGNPSRFRTGRVPLRPDEKWRESMPPQQRRLVTAMTYPLARHYGYLD